MGQYKPGMADGMTGQDSNAASPPAPVEDGSLPLATPAPADSGSQAEVSAPTTPEPVSPTEGAPAPEKDIPRDSQGKFAPKSEKPVDPIKTLAERLVQKPTEKSVDGKAPEPKPAPKEPAKAEKPVEKPAEKTEDPFQGLSEAARAAIKSETKDRIVSLHTRARNAETELEKAKPLIDDQNFLRETFAKNGVSDADVGFVPGDHLAGLVKSQAAVNRIQLAVQQGRRPAAADLQVASAFLDNVNALAKDFGFAPAVKTEQEAAFTGEIPSTLKGLVDADLISEEQARILAAHDQRKAKAATAAKEPSKLPPPTAPEGVDMGAIAKQNFLRELVSDKIPSEDIHAHTLVLMERARGHLAQKYPDVPGDRIADIFNAMSEESKINLLRSVHRASKAASPVQPTMPPPTKPQTPRVSVSGNAPAGDPLAAVRARLVGAA